MTLPFALEAGRQAARISTKPKTLPPDFVRYLDTMARRIERRGGSQEAIADFVQRQVDDWRDPAPNAPPSVARGVALNTVQGSLLGSADESLALINALATGTEYEENLADYRREFEEFAKNHRGIAIGAEIAGALLTGGMLSGRAGAVLSRVIKPAASGPTFGQKLLVNAIQAGVAGGISGAAHAEGDLSDRAKGLLYGALLSAGVTAGISTLGTLGSTLIKATARSVARNTKLLETLGLSPRQAALREIGESIAEVDALPFDELRDRVANVSPTMATVLYDLVGDATATLGQQAASTRSPAAQAAIRAAMEREATLPGRVGHQVFQAVAGLNRSGFQVADDAITALGAKQTALAAPFYDDAFQQSVRVTPKLRSMLENPRVRKLYNSGAGDAAVADLRQPRGLPVPSLGDDIPDMLPIRALDGVKRGLDQLIAKGALRGDRRRDYVRLVDDLRNEVARQPGAESYAVALTIWKGFASAKDAVASGQKVFRQTIPDIAKTRAKYGPTELPFYRIGVAQAAHDRVTKGDLRAFLPRELFSGGSIEAARMRTALGGRQADDIMGLLAISARVQDGMRRLPSGGQPREALERMTQEQIPAARPSIGMVAASAGRTATAKAQARFRDDVDSEITRLLLDGANDPAKLLALIDEIEHAFTTAKRASTTLKRTKTTVGGALLGAQVAPR